MRMRGDRWGMAWPVAFFGLAMLALWALVIFV